MIGSKQAPRTLPYRAIDYNRIHSEPMIKNSTGNRLEEFESYRSRLNMRILDHKKHRGIKRFFNLDTSAYTDGPLDKRTKELLGLVASMVLRCQDCIDYHIVRCIEEGYSEEELDDAMNVALVVGGSIVIPHLRRAVETADLAYARENRRKSSQ